MRDNSSDDSDENIAIVYALGYAERMFVYVCSWNDATAFSNFPDCFSGICRMQLRCQYNCLPQNYKNLQNVAQAVFEFRSDELKSLWLEYQKNN